MINILINSCWFTISLKINTSCVTDVLSKLRKVSVSKLVPFHSETYYLIQVYQLNQYYVFSITFGIEFLPFINDFFSSTRQIYQICQGRPKTGNKGKREIINTPMDTDEKEKAKTLNSLILNLTCFIIELPSSIVIV